MLPGYIGGQSCRQRRYTSYLRFFVHSPSSHSLFLFILFPLLRAYRCAHYMPREKTQSEFEHPPLCPGSSPTLLEVNSPFSSWESIFSGTRVFSSRIGCDVITNGNDAIYVTVVGVVFRPRFFFFFSEGNLFIALPRNRNEGSNAIALGFLRTAQRFIQ